MIELKEGNVFEGEIDFQKSGNASIKIGDKEIFIFKNNTLNSLNKDTVKVEIFKKNKRIEGKVIEVVKRYRTQFVGTVDINKNSIFVIPDSNQIHVDFYIKGGLSVKDSQKVIVELVKWDGSKSPQGKIVEILGVSGENNAEINSIMVEYGLPNEFPKMVEVEAELIPDIISNEEIEKRRDLRQVTTIGIDPIDSKDADDTIGLEFINGERFISINIADVTHYVKSNSDLDKEAYRRGTSVYLVDRCIPMIPHRLSNNICSLKSGKDKLCYSVILKVDNEGNILDEWFGRTVINVDKDYSYEDAQSIIENGVNEDSKKTDEVVLELDRIAKKIRKRRISNGSIEMGGVEVKFKLAEDDKKPIGVYFKYQKDANKLIEEYMLLANKSVAKLIKSKGLPCVNRVHEDPDDEKLLKVKKFVDTLGYKFDISDPDSTKKEINRLLKEIKDTPEDNIISTLIVRSQKKAYYSTKVIGHYGLGFEDYSHFTSPIRRYSDVLTHRLLSVALGNDGYPKK
jgi:ribonuclease R